MSVLKLEKIVSFSSESKKHPSSNLLYGGPSNDPNKIWVAQSATEEKAFVVIKLQEPAFITAIDIGNHGSAFIEVLVSNDRKDFVRLLPSSSFMSPMESRMNETPNRIRSFSRFESEAAAKPWTYVKFVCSQPYNKNWPFGIVFVALRGSIEKKRTEVAEAGQAAATRTADIDECREKNAPPKAKRFAPNRGGEVDSDDEPESQGKESRPPSSSREAENGRGGNGKKILDGVVIVLSGFQNPLRSQLRDMALSMGAKYQPDWNPRCTHLISAFSNTPKWSQVAAVGGRIVTQGWLEECKKAHRKLPWKQFKCGKYRDKVQDTADQADSDLDVSEEEEDIADDDSEYDPGKDSGDDSDGASRARNQQQESKRAPQSPPPSLPDDIQIQELKNIFREKHFYLDSDIDCDEEKDTLTRYIVGHGGELCSDSASAEYVISWKPGAHSPLWVVKCHQENRIVEE